MPGAAPRPLTALPTLLPGFDAVINTVPAPVLPRTLLQQLPGGALIIDLASLPGGTDFAAAEELGLHAEHALALPALRPADSRGADSTDRAGDPGRTRSRRKEHRPMTTQSNAPSPLRCAAAFAALLRCCPSCVS